MASGLTQLTDGSLLKLTPEEFQKKLDYLIELLNSLKIDKPDEQSEITPEKNIILDEETGEMKMLFRIKK